MCCLRRPGWKPLVPRRKIGAPPWLSLFRSSGDLHPVCPLPCWSTRTSLCCHWLHVFGSLGIVTENVTGLNLARVSPGCSPCSPETESLAYVHAYIVPCGGRVGEGTDTQGIADVAVRQKAELCLPTGRAFPKISKWMNKPTYDLLIYMLFF